MDLAREQRATGFALVTELTKHPFTSGDNTLCTLDKALLSDVSRPDARRYYSRRRWSEQPLHDDRASYKVERHPIQLRRSDEPSPPACVIPDFLLPLSRRASSQHSLKCYY